MALIHKLFGRRKTLSDLRRQELRRQEILLEKQRDRLMARIEKLVVQKQQLFVRGAQQKNPELRKSLAMQFELLTQEQLMVARQLNVRQKELLTVGRLRMLKEDITAGSAAGSAAGALNLTEKDLARIGHWIDDHAIGQEVYQQRLDQVLELGARSDSEALAAGAMGHAAQELLDIWNRLDQGQVKQDQAFEQADKAARRHAASADAQP
jgi:hypothetical protein